MPTLIPRTNESGQTVTDTVPDDSPMAGLAQAGEAAAPTVLQHTVTLTAEQIKALKASPITVLPALGAGKSYSLQKVVSRLAFGTTPFDDNGGNAFPLWSGSITGFVTTALQVVTTAASSWIGVDLEATNSAALPELNQPLVLQGGDAEYLAGDGALTITVFYSKLDLS